MSADNTALLIKACHFAAVAHRNQLRKDNKTPYINHPIGVSHILTELGAINDANVLCAALLHDTIEDTDTTSDDIERHFGAKIRSIVDEVTDDKSLPKAERKRLQIIHAPAISREARLVKLADKLYNLRDLNSCPPVGWSEARVREYYEWAAKVVAGLKGENEPIESELRRVLAERGVALE